MPKLYKLWRCAPPSAAKSPASRLLLAAKHHLLRAGNRIDVVVEAAVVSGITTYRDLLQRWALVPV